MCAAWPGDPQAPAAALGLQAPAFREKDPGSIRGRGLGTPPRPAPRSMPGQALPWRRERPAPPRPPPGLCAPKLPGPPPGVGVAGPYRGLWDAAAEKAPAQPRWWAPRAGRGGTSRKRGHLPSRLPFSRSGRGKEMASEASVELPGHLA